MIEEGTNHTLRTAGTSSLRGDVHIGTLQKFTQGIAEIQSNGACGIPVSRKRPLDEGIVLPPRAEDTCRARSRELKLDKYDGSTNVDAFLDQILNMCEAQWMGRRGAASSTAVCDDKRCGGDSVGYGLRGGREQCGAHLTIADTLRRRTAGIALQNATEVQAANQRRKLGHAGQRHPTDGTSLAYPGPTSPIKEAVACDAFLDALNDPVMALKVREREPPSLEEAFQIALRLEAYAGSGLASMPKESERDWRGHCRATQAVPAKASDDQWLEDLRDLKRRQRESSRRMLKELKRMTAGTGSSQAETTWGSSTSTSKSPTSSNPTRSAWEESRTTTVGEVNLLQMR